MTKKIDHLVYCVQNLEDAISDLEKKLGVTAIIGGRHTTQGTKNALINLGDKCYLEILAIDHENQTVKTDRWMGIDLLQESKITRWAIKSNKIIADAKYLEQYNKLMGHVTKGSRKMTNGKTLIWQIAMPLSAPEIDIAPFITDWSDSDAHPTDSLDHKCKLLELRLSHPNPKDLENLFYKLDIGVSITKSENISIKAIIQCPKGIVHL